MDRRSRQSRWVYAAWGSAVLFALFAACTYDFEVPAGADAGAAGEAGPDDGVGGEGGMAGAGGDAGTGGSSGAGGDGGMAGQAGQAGGGGQAGAAGGPGSAPTERYLHFDGVDDFVELLPTGSLNLDRSEFTISAWIRPAGWGENSQGRIVDHGGGSGLGWAFHPENTLDVSAGLRVQFNHEPVPNTSSPNVVSLGAWQHVAAVFSDPTVSFYVDGVDAGSVANMPVPERVDLPIRVGCRATDQDRAFLGGIDELRIWSRALSGTEIQLRMNTELSGTQSDLLLYFKFNEGSGQVAIDSSPHGRDGILGTTSGADDADPDWVP